MTLLNHLDVEMVHFLILSILLTSSFERKVDVGDSIGAYSPKLVHFCMNVVNSTTYSFISSFVDWSLFIN